MPPAVSHLEQGILCTGSLEQLQQEMLADEQLAQPDPELETQAQPQPQPQPQAQPIPTAKGNRKHTRLTGSEKYLVLGVLSELLTKGRSCSYPTDHLRPHCRKHPVPDVSSLAWLILAVVWSTASSTGMAHRYQRKTLVVGRKSMGGELLPERKRGRQCTPPDEFLSATSAG